MKPPVDGDGQGRATLSALVVDDDADVRKVLEFTLALEGLEVMGAPDGPSALQIVRDRRPDVVLLDVMMSPQSGYEVVEALRRDDGTSHLPVIMVSARADDESVWRAWAVGADSYLTKPLDPDLLMSEILRVTREARGHRLTLR